MRKSIRQNLKNLYKNPQALSGGLFYWQKGGGNTKNIVKYLKILLLSVAIAVLLCGQFGILTAPGIVIAGVLIYCTWKAKHILVAAISIITATGSYIAQSHTLFCMTCTLAATLFAMTGILALMQDKAAHLKTNLVLVVILIAGIFSLNSMVAFYQNPAIPSSDIVVTESFGDRAALYISPACGHCDSIIDAVIQHDQKGDKCVIVSVPVRTLAQTESALRERGYTGEILSAVQSPTGYVPVLIDKGRVIRGNSIIDYVKGGQ